MSSTEDPPALDCSRDQLWVYNSVIKRCPENTILSTLEKNQKVENSDKSSYFQNDTNLSQRLRELATLLFHQIETKGLTKIGREFSLEPNKIEVTSRQSEGNSVPFSTASWTAEEEFTLWNQLIENFENTPIYRTPWFILESWVYRKMLEYTGYFEVSSPLYRFDIFFQEKKDTFYDMKDKIIFLYHLFSEPLLSLASKNEQEEYQMYDDLIQGTLWANKADLSMFSRHQLNSSSSSSSSSDHGSSGSGGIFRVNEIAESWKFIKTQLLKSEKEEISISFINDNSGIELSCDVLLAIFLIFLFRKYSKKN
eukprot:TRINITY_DN5129_c0_g1_i1.p1 TRINITY_DN5129_c0_g1~~TRINITY_DN5129_c0_g1_i1.p1  ORF type:complete len:310 (+),score=74.35 TRINITY_DN5129_c0_g1_i1:93-1022(+)